MNQLLSTRFNYSGNDWVYQQNQFSKIDNLNKMCHFLNLSMSGSRNFQNNMDTQTKYCFWGQPQSTSTNSEVAYIKYSNSRSCMIQPIPSATVWNSVEPVASNCFVIDFYCGCSPTPIANQENWNGISKMIHTNYLGMKCGENAGNSVEDFRTVHPHLPPETPFSGLTSNDCNNLTLQSKTHSSMDGEPLENTPLDLGKFSSRFDVIKKTIFRKVKKYFYTDFKLFFDFTKRQRRRDHDYNNEIFMQARRYVNQKFQGRAPEGLEWVIVAMVDVKKKYTHSDPQFAAMRQKLLNLVKVFNLTLLDDIMEWMSYRYLVYYCLNNADFVRDLIDSKLDPVVRQRYVHQIYQIQQKWLGRDRKNKRT